MKNSQDAIYPTSANGRYSIGARESSRRSVFPSIRRFGYATVSRRRRCILPRRETRPDSRLPSHLAYAPSVNSRIANTRRRRTCSHDPSIRSGRCITDSYDAGQQAPLIRPSDRYVYPLGTIACDQDFFLTHRTQNQHRTCPQPTPLPPQPLLPGGTKRRINPQIPGLRVSTRTSSWVSRQVLGRRPRPQRM